MKTLEELQEQWKREQRALEDAAITESMQTPMTDEELDALITEQAKREDAIENDANGERAETVRLMNEGFKKRHPEFFLGTTKEQQEKK